jgi:hypothetical protein
VIGHGSRQFAVQYARVRSPDEIELSSARRQSRPRVRTAHNDWLELLVDGGLPALVLFSLALIATYRGAGDKTRLLPLCSAAAADARAVTARQPRPRSPLRCCSAGDHVTALPLRASRLARIVAAVLGLLLVALGLVPIAANCLFAPYLSAVAYGGVPPRSAVAAAAGVDAVRNRAGTNCSRRNSFRGRHLANAARTAARALSLRAPTNRSITCLLGEVLARERSQWYEDAVLVARHGLQIRSAEPRAPRPAHTVFRATVSDPTRRSPRSWTHRIPSCARSSARTS